MITGEAGIGKTALAAHLEAEAGQDGATVLHTRCYEAEQSLFLQPIVDAVTPAVSRMTGAALRDLLGEHAPVLAALLPDAAAVLGPPPSWRGSPEMERRRSFEAVTAFLSGLAGRNPVLFVVDDLQYAGKSTVEFTHYLSRHLSDGRLLVVVTVRAEDHEQAGAVLAPVATRVELARPGGGRAAVPRGRAAGKARKPYCGGPAATPCSWWRSCARSPPGMRACRSRCSARCRRVCGAPVRPPSRCCAPELFSARRSTPWCLPDCSAWHPPPCSICASRHSRPGC